MGISGHILGDRKLRTLSERAGLDLARAYRRGAYCEAVVRDGDTCHHYEIDYWTGEAVLLTGDVAWASCPDGCDAHQEWLKRRTRREKGGR
jgi:hypothetical protein